MTKTQPILNLKEVTDHASYGIPFKTKGLPMNREDLIIKLDMTPLEKLGQDPKFKKALRRAYIKIKISAFFYKLFHRKK